MHASEKVAIENSSAFSRSRMASPAAASMRVVSPFFESTPSDLNPAIINPGHGIVMHDTSYLKILIKVFQTLFAQVKPAAAQGLSLDDIRKKVTMEDYK